MKVNELTSFHQSPAPAQLPNIFNGNEKFCQTKKTQTFLNLVISELGLCYIFF